MEISIMGTGVFQIFQDSHLIFFPQENWAGIQAPGREESCPDTTVSVLKRPSMSAISGGAILSSISIPNVEFTCPKD